MIILSPRVAKDVLDLDEESKAMEKTERNQLAYACVTIADSLKATRLSFKWFQILKKWEYRRYTPGFIMSTWPVEKIVSRFNEVLEIEGVKKKVETVNQSGEMLQEAK